MPGANAYVAWDLMDIRSGKSLAARRLEGGELIVLADQIVADVLPLLADQCGVETSISQRSVSELTSASFQAYQYFTAGMLAREEQRHANAIRYFEQALEYDSTFALALFRLSEVHFESGERGQLVRDYANRAWELAAHLTKKDLMRLKAWRQRMNWNFPDALATYREMLNEWPDDQEVIRELTSVLFYFRYFTEAAEVARKGFKLYPDDQILAGFGWPSLACSGHMEEAIASIRKYLERHPRSVRGWEELGWRYLQKGKTDSAEAAFHRVLEIDPTFLEAQSGIGRCYYQRGNLNKAVDTFEQILRRSDLLPSVRVFLLTSLRQGMYLSWLYAEKGRFEKALELFEEARQLVTDPERDARLERERGWLLLRMKRADEVLLAARNLAKRTESTYAPTVALEMSARAFVVLDSLETAEHIVAELGSIRDWWGAYIVLLSHKITAEIALARGNPERALVSLKEMERQAAFGPGLIDIEYREDLARSYRMAGQLGKAAEALRELLHLYGGHAIAHYELGLIYEELDRPDAAKQEYEKFLQMWSEADEGLPQVEDTKRRLAALEKQNI